MTPSGKLRASAGLFALTLILVATAAAAQSAIPLFVAWVPLGLVAWVLTKPGPDWEPSQAASDVADEPERVPDDSPPTEDVGSS